MAVIARPILKCVTGFHPISSWILPGLITTRLSSPGLGGPWRISRLWPVAALSSSTTSLTVVPIPVATLNVPSLSDSIAMTFAATTSRT